MNANSKQNLWNTPDPRLATARQSIEREFQCLLDQQPRLFQLALNEAEALAWQTGVPHLVFPTLAAEKAETICAWHQRQKSIRSHEPVLAFAA